MSNNEKILIDINDTWFADIFEMDKGKCEASEKDNRMVNASEMDNRRFNTSDMGDKWFMP